MYDSYFLFFIVFSFLVVFCVIVPCVCYAVPVCIGLGKVCKYDFANSVTLLNE